MFIRKLNKSQNGFYILEDEQITHEGKWEGYLDHDNVNNKTILVYTGPKLTGDRVTNFFVSTPAEMPWKTHLKVFSDSDKIYIVYESEGDQVEADDINLLQDGIESEVSRSKDAEHLLESSLNQEIARSMEAESALENTKSSKIYVDTELLKKSDKADTYTKTETDTRIQNVVGAAPAALDTLREIAEALNNDSNFAGTITSELSNKVDKISGKQLSTNDYTTIEKSKLAGIEINANNYSHPSTHPASMIVESTTKRFVTDTDKAKIGLIDNKSDKTYVDTELDKKIDKSGGTISGELRINNNVVVGNELSIGNSGSTDALKRFKLMYNSGSGKLELWGNNSSNVWVLLVTFPGRSGGGGIIVEGKNVAFAEDMQTMLDGKVDNSRVLTDVPTGAKFSDTVTTINGKTGSITKDDITALGIPSQDTVYTHPTTAGNKHIPTGGTVGQVLKNTASGTVTWQDEYSYTHPSSHSISEISGLQGELDSKVDNSRVLTDVPANAKFTDTNTTYSEITIAEIDAGTAATLRTITARRLKYIIDKIPTKTSQIENDSNFVTQSELGSAGYGDMVKSVYDSNGNGIVDNAEKVNGFTVDVNVPASAKFTDTTYSSITQAEAEGGISTTGRLITGQRLKQAIEKHATKKGPLTWNDLGGA